MQPNPPTKYLVNQLIRVLSGYRNEEITDTMAYVCQRLTITVAAMRKWRRSEKPPAVEYVQALAEIAVEEAEVKRNWTNAFLTWGRVPNAESLLHHWFPTEPSVQHNLPLRPGLPMATYPALQAQAAKWLDPTSAVAVCQLTGLDAVVAHHLALALGWEAAKPSVPPPTAYNAVIRLSALPPLLTANRLYPTLEPAPQLADLWWQIADVLAAPDIFQVTAAARLRRVRSALHAAGHVLLILEGMEASAAELAALLPTFPATTKTLLISRVQLDFPHTLVLPLLDSPTATTLAVQECTRRALSLPDAAIAHLVRGTYGLPSALTWAIGGIAREAWSVESALQHVHDPRAPLQQFLFRDLSRQLQDTAPDDYAAWLALAHFAPEEGVTPESLARVHPYPPAACATQLQHLAQWHLGQFTPANIFVLHPLAYAWARTAVGALQESE
ncbi:MAG TPA: hypothetical protein PKH77_26375 [Anaerolineae bacterium]|nr:hypothetical protein [Anaerolineae bacterium]